MKRVLKLVAITFLFFNILTVFSFASGMSTYTFYYNDREITVESTYLTEDDAQKIADYIVYGIMPASPIEPGNILNTPLLCILFGHSIETSIAIETIHNVYTTSPKCVENKYSVEVCTRSSCDYFESTLIYSHRIALCHG